ncbi:hypothetical protein Pcinc_006348 [Petrolisthes cinctipes]|uniref:Uncharacterized protein n=1 Tax=Petrolisthes cinctipes TaxID=88211 RepID=A0AAE1GDF1_PETCI|nr:hypothetical protein Pcinc_006348 [Petrolisthes cinctipes]
MRVVGGGGVLVPGEEDRVPSRRDARNYSQVVAPEVRGMTQRQRDITERGLDEERNSFLEFQSLMQAQMQQMQRQVQILLNKEAMSTCMVPQMKQCGCVANQQVKVNV